MDAAHDRLLAMIGGSWVAQAVHVAAALNLADELADGPLTVRELAERTASDGDTLRRLLRALCTVDVVIDHGGDRFGLAVLGQPLRTDHPQSVRSWAIWWGTQLWRDWGGLLQSVKTGEPARVRPPGADGFGHLTDDDEAAAVFHRAMVELTRLTAERVADGFDFSHAQAVVDVGGGSGAFLLTILTAHPRLTGTVFDQAHARAHAEECISAANCGERCTFIAGDFFERVPAGADVYLLKSVLHDWPDEKARLILRRCREAMPGHARLLLVERMLPERLDSSPDHRDAVRADLTMLVAWGTRERTAAEFNDMLAAAGLALERSEPLGMGLTLVVAAPA